MQRGEEIRAMYVSRPLLDTLSSAKKDLERDAKIIAATTLYLSMFDKKRRGGPLYVDALLPPLACLAGIVRVTLLDCVEVCQGFKDN